MSTLGLYVIILVIDMYKELEGKGIHGCSLPQTVHFAFTCVCPN